MVRNQRNDALHALYWQSAILTTLIGEPFAEKHTWAGPGCSV
jgi:hypothetical protein